MLSEFDFQLSKQVSYAGIDGMSSTSDKLKLFMPSIENISESTKLAQNLLRAFKKNSESKVSSSTQAPSEDTGKQESLEDTAKNILVFLLGSSDIDMAECFVMFKKLLLVPGICYVHYSPEQKVPLSELHLKVTTINDFQQLFSRYAVYFLIPFLFSSN